MTRQSIFEYLTAKSICFSVCVSTKEANNVSLTGNSRDYFITVKKSDIKPKIKDKWLFKNVSDRPNVLIRDMTGHEEHEFKEISDKFTKVIHDKDGRVYELKSESFKRHLEAV